MLYYFFTYLQEAFNFPGAGVFQYISFRAAMAVIVSLLISLPYYLNIYKISFIDSNAKDVIAAGPRPLILRVLAKCSIFFDDWSPQRVLRQYKS